MYESKEISFHRWVIPKHIHEKEQEDIRMSVVWSDVEDTVEENIENDIQQSFG